MTELWAGSIEVGVTVHKPEDIVLPPTMTSMPTGTWMLSGTSVIINGKEVKKDYSRINLESLKVQYTAFAIFPMICKNEFVEIKITANIFSYKNLLQSNYSLA